MKIGENGIIVFKMYDLDMTAVDKVIFTFRGIEKLEKDYPSAYVNYADGRFYVGLTQEDTLILSRSRRVKVQAEAQICFSNGSVAKSDTIDFLLNDTLNTNVIPGNAPSDFVNEIEFHYEKGIIIIGGSGLTEQRVREIISGYHFVTSDALNDYVTLTSLNAKLNDYVTKNGLDDAIATYVDENVDLSQYATKTELNDYATKTELGDYAEKTDLGDYATKAETEEALADKQDKIQFSTMPVASANYEDKVIQYTGTTTSVFTKGSFYECVADNDSYEWKISSEETTQDKCIITVIDDGGRTTSTGLISFLESKGIPLCLGINSYQVGTNNKYYSLADLKSLESEHGVEIIMRSGSDASFYTDSSTVEEFRADALAAKSYAETNGFNPNLRIYPYGMRIYNHPDSVTKIGILDELGVQMAFNLENNVEMYDVSEHYPEYAEWYTYANGHEAGLGIANVKPFVEMPNGYGKNLCLNRAEMIRSKLTDEQRIADIHSMIEQNRYVVFFLHSYQDEWSTAGEDGKTTTQLFEEFIQSLIDTYGDKIEWKTASEAYEIINSVSATGADLDKALAKKQNVIQYSVLPTASVELLGKIYQYTGTTNATYIHGYFYECVSDGAATPAYSWSNTSVGSGGEMETMTQEEMLDILNGGD